MNGFEKERLEAHSKRKANWKEWGPYLSERSWGTVREDYSIDGSAWNHLPFEDSHLKAYRWNEDGLGGISDRNQYLCFALAFWNGVDPILKERLFGLSGLQGNHGEDVKESYFYIDNVPTHSYMKMLYQYPQNEFPYQLLIQENAKRSLQEPEYELIDTGIFQENAYFDIVIEYAKSDPQDILINVTAFNRSSKPAQLHFLPTLWFRNTWSWGYHNGPMGDVSEKPILMQIQNSIKAVHPFLEHYSLYVEETPLLLFTENETNLQKLYGTPNPQPYVKDAFHRYLINKEANATNPDLVGTKAAALYSCVIDPQGCKRFRLRLKKGEVQDPFTAFDSILAQRKAEADSFYSQLQSPQLSSEEKMIQRQAFAGILWSKQLYYYDIEQWLKGDPPPLPPPPANRHQGRNSQWEHLVNFDIISMPDKWEYPWYASWDLAFQTIPLVLLDPDFAKRQLLLMTREWYMHPNGQIPAYEWEFSNVNPPVTAWAAWRVYKIDAKANGVFDTEFLQGIFHKLLLNFTWWVNRKDVEGKNVFQGGFLGLDNISVFDRNKPLPEGHIDQSDGTAWMGFYCVGMMKIALELSKLDPVYQDSATKFFEHFLRIAAGMNNCGGKGISFWDEEDGFYYDVLHLPNGVVTPLKVRSIVGLLPLLAVETLEPGAIKGTPIFEKRVEWFISKKAHVASTIACVFTPGLGARRLMSIVNKERLISVLKYMLDENEFLSPYGIRSLSKYHEKHPYIFKINGVEHRVNYQPAESQSTLFGGNSNWRGPVWLPINYLLIETLQKYYHYYGDELKVEFPTGSGQLMNLWEISKELAKRLIKLFKCDGKGQRPIYKTPQENSAWPDLILFHEYFHGDDGRGLGASHQTGWTALVAKLIQQFPENE
jgi:Glycosyl hydrolase family 63 C-terminal domain